MTLASVVRTAFAFEHPFRVLEARDNHGLLCGDVVGQQQGAQDAEKGGPHGVG